MQNLVRTLSEKDINDMKIHFKILDRTNLGFINIKQFLEYLKRNCRKLDSNEIEGISSGLDQNKNGLINYSEFLAATISSRKFLTEEKMWRLFKFIDHDDKGYIIYDDIQQILSNSSNDLLNSNTPNFIRNKQIPINNEISFDEILRIFANL